MILLIHDQHTLEGKAHFSIQESRIAGEIVQARHYEQEGKFVLVRHKEKHVEEHDVEQLHRLGYRVATASEQEEYAAMIRRKRSLREKGK